MSMTTFDGVVNDPLNVAPPELLKVHRETPPGANVLPTNNSPHGLKPLHEVMRKIGVSDLRADLVERLERFEEARHRMRVACFRVSLTEGLSIGGIARLWGISRQLASRLVNEPANQPTPPEHQNAPGALASRSKRMITKRTASRREPDSERALCNCS